MKLFKVGLTFIILGFALAFVAVLLPIALGTASSSQGINVSGGGCVVIMFIPICFGVGEYPLIPIMVSAVLALLLMVFGFMILRWMRNLSTAGAPT